MVTIYIMTNEEVGDRIFNEIPATQVQLEGRAYTLEELQKAYNMGALDPSTSFMRVISR